MTKVIPTAPLNDVLSQPMNWLTSLLIIAGALLLIAGVVLVILDLPGAVLPFFPGSIGLALGIAWKIKEKRDLDQVKN